MGINWRCGHTWKRASYNTAWCLLGCVIGDFGTIAYFQFWGPDWPVLAIMSLAILAFRTAVGMSLVSMISMEAAMNITDVVLTGGAILTWWVIPIMLLAGFITPLPYNYWRLKALGKACH